MIVRGPVVVIDGYTARVLAGVDLPGVADRLRLQGSTRAAHAIEVLAHDLADLARESSAAGTDERKTAEPDPQSSCDHLDGTADHDLLSAAAADLLGQSDRWVRRLAERGDLPGAYTDDTGRWRIPRDAVLSYHRTRTR